MARVDSLCAFPEASSFILAACLSLCGSFAGGANQIDPDGQGSTDVLWLQPEPVQLTNPLPDRLNQGADSLVVGHTRVGALGIDNGSSITSRRGELGGQQGSVGVASIEGAGSRWNNNVALLVGARGSGVLSISRGGSASGQYATIGRYLGSRGHAIVDGEGSKISLAGALNVGKSGAGSLVVSGGGAVTNQEAFIGAAPGGSGEVRIAGDGSVWSHRNLTVGGDSFFGSPTTGSLHITSGGFVSSAAATVGDERGATGEVLVDGPGSLWSLSATLQVGKSGTGAVTITGGALVQVGGGLTIDGDFDQNDSINLSTGGTLALAGVLDSDLDEFLGENNAPGSLRYWDARSAAWRPMIMAARDRDYTLQYFSSGDFAGYTLLTVGESPETPGDYNGDGEVDAADYSVWRDRLGEDSALPNETATPGRVTPEDYQVWRVNYASSYADDALDSVVSPAPAPGSSTLLALLSLFAFRTRCG